MSISILLLCIIISTRIRNFGVISATIIYDERRLSMSQCRHSSNIYTHTHTRISSICTHAQVCFNVSRCGQACRKRGKCVPKCVYCECNRCAFPLARIRLSRRSSPPTRIRHIECVCKLFENFGFSPNACGSRHRRLFCSLQFSYRTSVTDFSSRCRACAGVVQVL